MIKEILQKKGKQTVFTLADISRMVSRPADDNLITNINYYLQKGELLSLSKGLYSLDKNFDRLELGNKLRKPSYISLYTVLNKEGIVFQQYETIYLISNRSEKIETEFGTYQFRKVKDEILLNPTQIVSEEDYSIASQERALCDKLYLDGHEYFDNMNSINWDVVENLNNEVYKSKSLTEFIKKYRNAQ